MNVELLLSALEACGVDNARIEVEGGHEIPVLDNSSLGWCIEVQVSFISATPAMHNRDGAACQRDIRGAGIAQLHER